MREAQSRPQRGRLRGGDERRRSRLARGRGGIIASVVGRTTPGDSRGARAGRAAGKGQCAAGARAGRTGARGEDRESSPARGRQITTRVSPARAATGDSAGARRGRFVYARSERSSNEAYR